VCADRQQADAGLTALLPPRQHSCCVAAQICEAFNANRYPFPEDPNRQRQMHAEVTARLRELHTTIEAGDRHREALLQNVAFILENWTTVVSGTAHKPKGGFARLKAAAGALLGSGVADQTALPAAQAQFV
jgi:hypothetical protein